MSLASLDYFLFLFIVIAVCEIFPVGKKNILIMASLLYLASWGWLTLVTFLGVFLVNVWLVRSSQNIASRWFLVAAIFLNLCVLSIFKWHLSNLESAEASIDVLRRNLLPIGLSYYIFQMMAYIIECRRGVVSSPLNFREYLFFNCFFAQITIGPIERYKNMVNQIREDRRVTFDDVRTGCSLIAVGLLKKLVIADRLFDFIKLGSKGESGLTGFALFLYLVLAFIHLYCDFSGYADIAQGSGRLLGYRISSNFNCPYLAKSIPDAWSRWHMSLVAWIKDFFFYPLVLKSKKIYLALFLAFIATGVWHSASWNYVAWACYWSILTIFHIESRRFHRYFEFIPDIIKRFYVLCCLALSTLFFMCHSISDFYRYCSQLLEFDQNFMSTFVQLEGFSPKEFGISLLSIVLLFFLEVGWDRFGNQPKMQYIRLVFLTLVIASLGRSNSYDFIYLSF
ncbi:MAG: MBOAT family protein [Bdellovibrionales bacterium]|nr:MBOAT family protein [Bdellovibrionales bacterium]